MDAVRYFTLEEAEDALPEIEKSLSEIKHLKKEIELLESVEIYDEESGFSNRFDPAYNKKLHGLYYDFYAGLEALENAGCILKDLETGLIDLLSLHEGREIFLCWQAGEDRIMYWHEVDAGFAGRQPVELLERE